MKQNLFKIWIMAFRPKTLSASFAPVFIATAMAFGDGVQHFPTAIICLLAAITIQIGTNLANDYFDYKKGTDNEHRIGPTRVSQAGLISPNKIKRGFIIVFLLAILFCAILAKRGGWPILILAVVSVASGILYTAGPYPLGYIGLGDLFVFVFFGPVAVAFTYYLQSYEMNAAVILAGISPGLISVAILTINNLRDHLTDSKTGKNTLVVRYGIRFAYYEYVSAIIAASLMPVIIYLMIDDHRWILLCSFIPILALRLIIQVLTCEDLRKLNPLLGSTGKLLLFYSLLFSIGWIL